MARHQQNIFAGGEVRKEAAVLDHVTDAAAEFRNVCRSDWRALETYGAAVRIEEANDQPQESRFSAAAGADEDGGFATRKVEIGGMEGNGIAVGFADAG